MTTKRRTVWLVTNPETHGGGSMVADTAVEAIRRGFAHRLIGSNVHGVAAPSLRAKYFCGSIPLDGIKDMTLTREEAN